jgi:GTP-binding protein
VPGRTLTPRRAGTRPVIVVPGKADNKERRDAANEFYALGFETVVPVSAIHGANTGDLLDAIVEQLPNAPPFDDEDDTRLRIAIVGRPNVGKSSLLNKLLGEERVVVSEVPGTTRDAIDSPIQYEGHELVLIDTRASGGEGGMGIEKYSVLRSLRSVERGHRAAAGRRHGDDDLAGPYIAGEIEEGRRVLRDATWWTDTTPCALHGRVGGAEFAWPVGSSHLTGREYARWTRHWREPAPQRISMAAQRRRGNPASRPRPPQGPAGQLYHDPGRRGAPTFIFFVNDPELIHFALTRFLENSLRAAYGFRGTPIRLRFRKRNPEADTKRGR